MVQILDVYERTLGLLASQFRDTKLDGGLTNLQKVIKIISDQAQNIQDVEWELKTERWLSTAIGAQLDEIGIILGLARNPGESDSDYRERLQFQIFINTSTGTPEEIIRVTTFLTRATYVWYHEIHPAAAYQVETNGLNFPNPPNDLNTALKRVSPAGVNYPPIVATYNREIPFELGGDLTPNPFAVVPDELNLDDLKSLLIEPQNSALYVSIGSVEDTGPNGGLDELGFPLPTAGQISELIQLNGNFPPRR